MDRIGGARLVLLGEASPGTQEFYRERARITQMLIEEKGFSAVAVEADWPDAYRVNRFVRNVSNDRGAAEALGDFGRFPRWMWRNSEVAEFIEWLRARYYRSMFFEDVSSWNLRDRHMVETLDALMAHLSGQGGPAKIVVWAHNSHLGDARATEMGERGELNVGQLVREKHGQDAVLVGFTTDHGTVTAASDWGGPAERKRVRPALAGSWERLFHTELPAGSLLTRRTGDPVHEALRSSRLERAIGVIYRPASERASHYFGASLGNQFDAILHFDETRALEPLDVGAEWRSEDMPETFPFAV